MFFLGFFIGLFLGANFGLFVFSIFHINKR